uniref:Importin N-terminal domain-containing protein n=1 Tax=Oryza meridionalis TaxID=40149 RepID=A0A0E0C0R2_9ORYZ
MESLAQLELLCEKLYNSRDSAERAHAESTLKCFSENSDYISQCQYILDNASTPYALMLASSSLLNQVNDRTNYVINYLATRGPKLQTFVIKSLIQLVCRITKFGWFDDDKFRDIVKEAADFLSLASQDHYFIGLKILYHLVGEMNQANAMPLTLHRKIACSFKDQFLLQIFQISLTSLHQLKSEVPDDFRRDPLSLALRCLSFDFVGCPVDESSEEFGTVQLPASWRPLLQDPSTVQIFFDYYKVNDTCVSKEALECLVRLASVRRSIFVEDPSRTQFLSHLMSGTKEILQTGQGLAVHGNYHEFCRLLGRFKVNFQWASNSVYYLLSLWSRLVTSVPYLKGDTPSMLDETAPKITEGFITSRINSVQASFANDSSDDTLDNVDVLQEQLESLPYLCRFQVAISCQVLANAMPLTLHRKIACSFKDQFLLQIFQISLTSLHQLKSEVPDDFRRDPLSLALRCLSYDFVGCPVDESSEEFGTVQLPASWRPLLQDPSTVQIFFDYYKVNDTCVSKEALECLVRLASVRRSIFVEDPSRTQFLSHLMSGTKEILQTGQGLAVHGNYHEFCRLLGRFKVNFQLSELLSIEFYGEWIGLVAEFTTKSLLSWQWASNSVYYLLSLWSRLVTSVPYLKGDTPSMLDETVPKITEGFITSRINSVQASFANDSSDDTLDNVDVLQEQLESLPYLCRFQYQNSSIYIINIMEPLLQAYTERLRLPAPGDANELSVIEGQLTWLVHIIAAILKIRQTIGCSQESQELIDAELAARVLQLINVTDTGVHAQRYRVLSKQRLDRAILIFVQNFRRSYVGDQAMHSSKQLYARLSELLGLNDHLVLLNAIVGKIATNLKCYAECEDVIDHTLSLFLELASGYMTGKLLLKLESTKFIIANRDSFPFLEEYRCARSRTTFYYILGCLVFMEDTPVKFRSFMEPLLQVAVNLEATADAAFRTDVVKYAFIGLMRDLRGIAMATNSRRTYGLLFDWLYPSRMPLLLKAISLYADEPEVTTPLLKFMCEFVLNKAQRLTFDSSSPNGILLFREVSKLIVAYGSRILLLPNGTDIYGSKYKGIWISLAVLSRALCGNYVNFGVFELYGDGALADALDISLKMSLSVPLSDILAFKKLSKAFYGYIEVLFSSHITFVLNLDTNTFVHIVSTLESGLKGLDTGISTQCASAIDSLAAFYFNNITAADGPPSPAALNLARHIGEFPTLFPQILKTLFEIIIFEDAGSNQWSLSRPILSLIMIREQPVDQQQRLSQCFEKLMSDVARNLEPKNRDKFTKNLTTFRHDFRVKNIQA